MRRKLIAAAGGTLAAVGLATATLVAPASADSGSTNGTNITSQARETEKSESVEAAQRGNGYFTASGVNIRTGPSTNRTVLGQGQKGQRIQVHSCRHGNPNSWWHVTNLATGVKGYVYWPNNVLFDDLGSQPPSC